jgi:hypothetical protein
VGAFLGRVQVFSVEVEMNAKGMMEYKRSTTVGIIIIYCLIFTGCFEIEIESETTTIYRNPNGNAKMTGQFSGIKSDGGSSEEQLETDYQLIMSIVNDETYGSEFGKLLNYIKIWINEDGFLEMLMALEGSEQEIFKEASISIKEDTIIKIWKKGAVSEKNIKTNGEKIINGDDLIIQWPMQTSILKWSKNNPYAKDTVDKLAGVFIKRNPKGVVEKHFDYK